MFFAASSVLLAALAGVAQAQTPQGFKPAVNTKLDVMFNTSMVMEPGQLLTKAGMRVSLVWNCEANLQH